MRIGYDRDLSRPECDYQETDLRKAGNACNIRVQQTLSAVESGMIDTGMWNYDRSIENQSLGGLHLEILEEDEYNSKFSAAVIVIQKGDEALEEFLKKNIRKEYTLMILEKVRRREMHPFY